MKLLKKRRDRQPCLFCCAAAGLKKVERMHHCGVSYKQRKKAHFCRRGTDGGRCAQCREARRARRFREYKAMEKKPRTSLWNAPVSDGESLSEEQRDFLLRCFEQNLEHARHVENERLTFNSIYMALVGGVLAFVYSTEVKYIAFSAGVTALLIFTGFIAMLLTKRWDNTFDRHTAYAKECYRLVHTSLFPDDADKDGIDNENGDDEEAPDEDGADGMENDASEKSPGRNDADDNEWINGINGLPAYAFRPKNPKSKMDGGAMAGAANYVYRHFRTRRLFKWFYWLIQLVLLASLVYFLTLM